MKSKQLLIGTLTLVVLLVISMGYALAKTSPPGELEQSYSLDGVNLAVSRSFTYQGALKENGQPVTGDR